MTNLPKPEASEVAEVNETKRIIRLGKSLLRTSESSRFLNTIILGLILLYFGDLKIITSRQNHENSC